MTQETEQKAKTAQYVKALSYAQTLFKFRPRSRTEFKGRLKLRRFSEEVIGSVIAALEKQGMVDDRKFAKLWAFARMQERPVSQTVIKQELRLKGIEPDIIYDILSQLGRDFNEQDIVKRLAEKKSRTITKTDPKKKKKILFDYLRRRGFSFDAIFKVVKLNEDDA